MSVEKIINDLIKLAERNICSHDETHRGGSIWTICSQCGAKWADDEGGKPEYVEPVEITNAHNYLKRLGRSDLISNLRNISRNAIISKEWQDVFREAADELAGSK